MIRLLIAIVVAALAAQVLVPSDAAVVAGICLIVGVGPIRLMRIVFGLLLMVRAIAGP